MARESNAVDFWRGYALAAIFVNHIPGIYYSRFTHTNFSISDSADLFVFLAGWAVRLLAGTGENPQPVAYMVLRVGGRAVTLYAAQVMITVLAIAMLASVAMLRDNALLLEWHNASAVFHDPVPAHIGLALITHQLGYFDILPLYVVLMATIAPVMVVVDRFAPNWLLPLSVVAYLGVLATRFNLPTWPVEGQWFFDPLAWQLVFVLGFVLAKPAGVGAFARRHIAAIRWAALPLVLLSVLVVRFDLWPDPTKMPQPRLFFIANKTFMTPMRLLQFLALVALMSAVFPLIRKAVPKLVDFLCLFGRNSLHVFCVGSLLSLGGQIIRFIYRGNL
ncbi:MAG TPA: OpgC domain-containing protein, partial [Pirellulales bacterium]|nr:OpgC domain-containing protein [Pirellulales bacterium]